ncbi:TRAP transporter small permease [uncultured Cohaesibacter sp.]|uniref:TRAP transporter small permease n=1 Tax=uncultured Cohaesibacter sp. TaxID=1002546 RepID=UPI002AAC1723|nr:TRAP transporter small permease [uncultured Cohaesibacter sp.]
MANILSKDMLLATGRLLKKAADAIGVLLFLFAFGGFIVQIFYRYVMNAPLLWTEEITMIAFIWTVFWAAAFMTPVQSHVSFDVVYDVVNPRTRRMFSIISMLALFISFVLLVPATWDYLQFLTRKKSSVLRLPMYWIYGCYMLFILGFIVQAVYRLYGLLSQKWEKYI